jgi:homoserine dehydrogenase
MKPLRIWLVGFGTVGQWLVRALDSQTLRPAQSDGPFVGGMSGTPLLRALVDDLADATPIALRGLLNATTNFILSRMTDGASYDEALAEAQRAGLAERDPAADVEGHDAVVKMMILSALVFGRQLRRDQVACRGITDILPSEVDEATARGARLKHVATLDFSEPDGAGQVSARVQPVPPTSRDHRRRGVLRKSARRGHHHRTWRRTAARGQGVFSDVIAVAISRSRD